MSDAPHGDPPSDWIIRHIGLIPPGGPALDVAAGGGRHTRLLLAHGHPVVAIDLDTSRLTIEHPDLQVLTADLQSARWPLADRRFAGVVVTRYLHRPLLPTLIESVAAGGVLLYETFMVGHPSVGGHPCNPAYLLHPGELVDVVTAAGLRIVASHEGRVDDPRPSVVQGIVAIRPPSARAAGAISRLAAPRSQRLGARPPTRP